METKECLSNHFYLFYCEKKYNNVMYVDKKKVKSKFYKKHGATFFYDITRKLGPLDFTQYRSKSSSF